MSAGHCSAVMLASPRKYGSFMSPPSRARAESAGSTTGCTACKSARSGIWQSESARE